jgi:hypothetical protein
MFVEEHDQMRQTQNGFGKQKWKPGEHEAMGGLQPDDEDSDEEEGVDGDEESEEDDGLQQEDEDEESDHNF